VGECFALFRFGILCFVLAGSAGCSGAPDFSRPSENGFLDLSALPAAGFTAELGGDWEFFWGADADLAAGTNGAAFHSRSRIRVPSDWNGLRYDGKILPGKGYALYRIRLRLPAPGNYAVRLGEVDTAWILRANGTNLAENGTFTRDARGARANWARRIVRVDTVGRDLTLDVLVSNWKHRRGGIGDEAPCFGTETAVKARFDTAKGCEVALASAIFAMALYHLFIFLLHRKETSSLFLTLASGLLILRILLTGEKQFADWFPMLDWSLLVRFEYLSLYLVFPLFVSFFRRAIPHILTRLTELVFWAAAFVLTVAVSILPVSVFSWTMPVFVVAAIPGGLFLLYLVVQAWRAGFSGGGWVVAGFVVLMIAGSVDALSWSGVLRTRYLLPWGLAVFVLAQSVFFFRRFTLTFERVESLSAELEQKNRELADRAEQLQTESDEKIRMLLNAIDQLGESLIITDTEGRIEYVNRKFVEVTGYGVEEVIGKNPRILKSGETPPDAYRYLWQSIRAGKEWQGEFHNRRKNGELYWENAAIAPIRNREGVISHFVAAKEDITDRKQIESVMSAQRKEISLRNVNLEKDLEMARKIQKQLLPTGVPDIRLASFWHPMELVGGDLFDFILFRESGLYGIFISDVSGHGTPAALVTAMVKSLVSQADERRYDPAAFLSYLNERLFLQTQDLFVTALYAVVDIPSRRLVFSSAGHIDPWLVGDGEPRQLTASHKSPPLAVMSNRELRDNRKPFTKSLYLLPEGCGILFCTDGLTECVPEKETDAPDFEANGLVEALRGCKDLTAQEMLEHLFIGLREYRGSERFEDDVCMVSVRI